MHAALYEHEGGRSPSSPTTSTTTAEQRRTQSTVHRAQLQLRTVTDRLQRPSTGVEAAGCCGSLSFPRVCLGPGPAVSQLSLRSRGFPSPYTAQFRHAEPQAGQSLATASMPHRIPHGSWHHRSSGHRTPAHGTGGARYMPVALLLWYGAVRRWSAHHSTSTASSDSCVRLKHSTELGRAASRRQSVVRSQSSDRVDDSVKLIPQHLPQ